MVVSPDRSLIDGIRDYREFDRRDDDIARFNFQMTDIQAAVGRVQLNRLGEFIYKRKEIYSFYKEQGLPLWPDGFCETAVILLFWPVSS